MGAYQRLGDLLLAKQRITQDQLDAAVRLKERSSLRFGEILVRLGYATEDDIAECLGQQLDLPVLDPARVRPNPRALALLSYGDAKESLILPVDLTPEHLALVVADPLEMVITDRLAKRTGRRLALAIATPRRLLVAIADAYEPKRLIDAKSKENW
ncbi:MAG TPA: hypothetical protein VMI31_08200 [Fimbriimonadaceae bacterium]|nr:hypothetical protein [Fimbriimonadaceae bacterium]